MALAGSAPPLTATDAFVATCFKPATTRATGTWLRTGALASLPRDTSLEGRQMTIPRRFPEAEENRTNVRRLRGTQQSVIHGDVCSLRFDGHAARFENGFWCPEFGRPCVLWHRDAVSLEQG